MPSLWPEYHDTTAIPMEGVLAVVSFGEDIPSSAPISLCLPMRHLSRPMVEVWRSLNSSATAQELNGVRFVVAGDFLFGTVAGTGPTETASRRAYTSIVETIRSAGFPHLVRVWNHVGDVNGQEEGMERYKLFSAGRHDALVQQGYTRERFPAASAVGMSKPGLVVYFLAARTPGEHVENPRQVSAYDYPPRYGRRSPSFARATVSESLIFVAGTSSVVGHETKHPGSVARQLQETLDNLETIIATAASRRGEKAGLADMKTAKVYVRNRYDSPAIETRMREMLPDTRAIFVESAICRKDLLLEIEGVVAL